MAQLMSMLPHPRSVVVAASTMLLLGCDVVFGSGLTTQDIAFLEDANVELVALDDDRNIVRAVPTTSADVINAFDGAFGGFHMSRAKCFMPHHAVRARKEGHDLLIAVCFTCRNARVDDRSIVELRDPAILRRLFAPLARVAPQNVTTF